MGVLKRPHDRLGLSCKAGIDQVGLFPRTEGVTVHKSRDPADAVDNGYSDRRSRYGRQRPSWVPASTVRIDPLGADIGPSHLTVATLGEPRL